MRHNREKVPAESKEALVQEKAESVISLPKYIENELMALRNIGLPCRA